MATIKIGVIGCGGISALHLKYLNYDSVRAKDCRVTAFCDVALDKALARRQEFGKGDELVTTDYRELLDSGVDAVVVCTPHPVHPEAAIEAFKRNIHVMLEKPVAITAADAYRINKAHRKSKSVYTIHFQHRHSARNRWIKAQIDSGLLGPLHKVNVTWNHWYRTQAYYDSGTWRGKWSTEGGGVLMNQCPHDLDLFTWWVGLPKTVDARIWLGRCHNVEVEDDISAMLEFENGAVGTINASTCDHPAITRWDIMGDNGSIHIEGENVHAFRLKEPLANFTASSPAIWEGPEALPVEVKLPEGPAGSERCWLNFLAAIRGEEKVWTDGEEGAKSLELANAIIASGFLGKKIGLPVNGRAYDKVFSRLCAGESGKAMSPQRGRGK